LFSPSHKQHNNKESLLTDLFERLNFEQSFFKSVFQRNSFLQNFINNNLCKVSRRRARDRDRNASRPRRDLRPPRPRLQKTGLETHLETETKSRDSITGRGTKHFETQSCFLVQIHAKGYQFDTQTSEIKICIICLHIMLSLRIKAIHHCKETDHVYDIVRTGHGLPPWSVRAAWFPRASCW